MIFQNNVLFKIPPVRKQKPRECGHVLANAGRYISGIMLSSKLCSLDQIVTKNVKTYDDLIQQICSFRIFNMYIKSMSLYLYYIAM